MTEMLDLEPAARQMSRLLAGVTDDQLTVPTLCRSSVPSPFRMRHPLDRLIGLSGCTPSWTPPRR